VKDKQYVIQGVKLKLGVMTLGQDKKLLQLFKGKSIDFSKMTGGVLDMIAHLVEADLIEDFLCAVLKGDVEKIRMDELTNDELEGIFTDFFELNSGWTKKLPDYLSSFLKLLAPMIPFQNSIQKITPTPEDSMTES
jgi:hypothetical protein